MPSTRNPVAVVQPGPGRLPAGTVSATSLSFDPSSGGGSASLEAHLTDPSGAHAASAISTLALTGERWSIGADDVQDTLKKSYDGLNARAYWVLDANSANLDADFSGPQALDNAVAAFATSPRKPALYLRAGVYSWANQPSTVLDRVRILGAGAGLPAPTNTPVVQINAVSNMLIGYGTVIEGVTVFAGTINLAGGWATLRRVSLNASAAFNNSSANNVLESVFVNVTASQTLTLSGANFSCLGETTLTCAGASTIVQSGNRGSFIGGKWSAATISVTGTNNTFVGVELAGTLNQGTNNFYLTPTSTTTGNVTVSGALQVNGNTGIQDNLTVGSDGTGTLVVNGPIFASGASGNISADGNLTVGNDGSGNLQVNGTISSTGDVTVGSDGSGNLIVNGTISTFVNPLTVNSSLNVRDDVTVGSDGTGNLQVNGTIGSTGDVTVGTDGSGNLSVNGTTTGNVVSSSTPTYQIAQSAHNHPGVPANRWKLISDWTLSDGIHVRDFSGEGQFAGGTGSTWCRTHNASWNPATQQWSRDNNGQEANILQCEYGELKWYGQAAGSGAWSDDSGWSSPARGNLMVGDTVAARNVTSSGPMTVGNGLTVSSGGITLNGTGTTSLGGNLDVNGNADVLGGDLRVLNSHNFSANQITGNAYKLAGAATGVDRTGSVAQRTHWQTIDFGNWVPGIPVASAIVMDHTTGGLAANTFITAGSDFFIRIPMRFVSGTQITRIQAFHKNTGSTPNQFSLVRVARNWSSGGSSMTKPINATSSVAAGTGTLEIFDVLPLYSPATINNDSDAWYIEINLQVAGSWIDGLRVEIVDPGPRNV